MDAALWIAEVLLGTIFLAPRTIKLTQPRTKLAAGPMHWAADVTDAQFRIMRALALTMVGAIATPRAVRRDRAHSGHGCSAVVTIFVAIAAEKL